MTGKEGGKPDWEEREANNNIHVRQMPNPALTSNWFHRVALRFCSSGLRLH
jgi:hypothetical protein